MKAILYPAIVVMVMACTQKSDQSHEHHRSSTPENANQVLYNEVMDIHDEVMPRMEDLYNAKKDLQEKIANTPAIAEEERLQLEQRITHIDSVSNLMMVWMRQFNPLPDSADQEAARAYLESEMEKIKNVREAMLSTLEAEKEN
ncbi:MAG: hypothetical protein ACOYXA_14610 [Bacteroidota bacterium]